MPTYQYACRSCGHTFEIVRSMSDEPLRVCPECGGELRKVYAPPSIAFKGSGFYATDHGKKQKEATGEETTRPSKGEPTGGKDKGAKTGEPSSGGEAAPTPPATAAKEGGSSTSKPPGGSSGGHR